MFCVCSLVVEGPSTYTGPHKLIDNHMQSSELQVNLFAGVGRGGGGGESSSCRIEAGDRSVHRDLKTVPQTERISGGL